MLGVITDYAPPAHISRKSLSWLFAIQIFILVPHFFTVPIWIAALWFVIAYWRWQIFQGAWSYPTKIMKVCVVIICSIGLVLSLGTHFTLESMISLLLIGFILKLLEMKAQKDFVLLIFISLFIVATQFIELNNFSVALYGFFCLALLFATLMQLYQKTMEINIYVELRTTVYILLQAFPLLIFMFVLIPRIGSFWAVPSPQHVKTGMSDSMSPGDISELIQSNEIAFRVTFDNNNVPAHEKLYWRGLVLSHFDGHRWSQTQSQLMHRKPINLHHNVNELNSIVDYNDEIFSYNIIVEPSGQPWVYALTAPKAWSNNVALANDMYLGAFSPVTQRTSYQVTSSLNYHLYKVDDYELSQNLQLPENGNLKTRQLARDWFAETGDADKFIQKILDYYQKNFFYTLRPPTMERDVIDEFLWQSKQGFCEHFAGSFVFFMRAAGIPARVVVGYQGGNLNSIEGYLTVHQRDAHAWAEVWLGERGWVRVDPTAAVAPERIRVGITDSLSQNDQQLVSRSYGRSWAFINGVMDQWDALNFQWARWVMNYDASDQLSLRNRLFGEMSVTRIIFSVLGVIAIVFLLVFILLLTNRKKIQLSPAQISYMALCKALKNLNVEPQLGEAPRRFILRAIAACPEQERLLSAILMAFEQLAFDEDLSKANDLTRLLKNLGKRKSIFGFNG